MFHISEWKFVCGLWHFSERKSWRILFTNNAVEIFRHLRVCLMKTTRLVLATTQIWVSVWKIIIVSAITLNVCPRANTRSSYQTLDKTTLNLLRWLIQQEEKKFLGRLNRVLSFIHQVSLRKFRNENSKEARNGNNFIVVCGIVKAMSYLL